MSVSELTVRCGDWDITNHNELHLHQDRGVSKVMIHPLYSGKARVYYNFALLYVKEDFKLDKHIAPICLPDIPDQKTGKAASTYYVISHFFQRNLSLLSVISMHRFNYKKFQKYLNKNSPKTGYRLHSIFKWEAKSPG